MKTFARLVPYPDGSTRAEDIVQAPSIESLSSMFLQAVLDKWKADGTYFQEVPALDINNKPLEQGAVKNGKDYENPHAALAQAQVDLPA